MPRKYIKRSDYWNKFSKASENRPLEDIYKMEDGWQPTFEGEPYYVSQAAKYSRTTSGGKSTSSRQNAAGGRPILDRFINIAEGTLPYNYRDAGYVDIQDAIQLCQKAYANVAIFRNTIDVMSEFSNSKIYLEGGNEKVRKFIYKWLEKIKIWQIKRDSQFEERNSLINGLFKKKPITNVRLNAMKIGTPPRSGTGCLWIFRSEGIS